MPGDKKCDKKDENLHLKISNGGCYRLIDSRAAQVATERHSCNLASGWSAATPLPRYALSILQMGGTGDDRAW